MNNIEFSKKVIDSSKREGESNCEHRFKQRQKQLQYGYNTVGYKNLKILFPNDWERKRISKEPNPHKNCSTRSFAGQIKVWRKLLHNYDNYYNTVIQEESSSSISEINSNSPPDSGCGTHNSNSTDSDDSFVNKLKLIVNNDTNDQKSTNTEIKSYYECSDEEFANSLIRALSCLEITVTE